MNPADKLGAALLAAIDAARALARLYANWRARLAAEKLIGPGQE
ncbi:MAG: hypothetical protein AB1591_04560 [Pseudomonadota bacterium]